MEDGRTKTPTKRGTFSANLLLTGKVTTFREYFAPSKNGTRAGWIASARFGFTITKRVV